MNLEVLRFVDPASREWFCKNAPLAESRERWETLQPEQRLELLGLLRLLPPSEEAAAIMDYSLGVKRAVTEKAMAIRLLGTWGRTSSFYRAYLGAVTLRSQETLLRYTLEELRFCGALVETNEPLAAVLRRCKYSVSVRFALWTLVVKITENATCLHYPEDVQWFSSILKASTLPAKGAGPSQLTPADLFSASWASAHLANADSAALKPAVIAICHGLYGSSHTGRDKIGACPAALPLMDAEGAEREVARALVTAERWSPQSYS